MKMEKSAKLFEEARKVIPGGVNSPVRAFRAVGGQPFFVAKAAGSRLYDVDGNSYIDYVCSWGPLILGHAPERVIAAVREAAGNGTSYGAPTELEVILAKMVIEALPSVEMVRLTSSGTEATMSALKLARGFTKRDKIIKFEGCYHGHADFLLVAAGSGAATFGIPDSPGVPEAVAKLTLTARYNDLADVEKLFEANKGEIAALILEPVVGNMGVVPPQPGFLEGLRELTKKHGALLVFDEVITGFRVSYGGAQAYYNVMPDLTCFGKIIGGGLPVGAYGGRADIMSQVSPSGPVYQAGTLSGNPLAVSAGIAALTMLREPGVYESLDAKAAKVSAGIAGAAKKAGVTIQQNRVGSLFSSFFTATPVVDWDTAKTSDTKKFGVFFQAMLERGVYFAPSQFEAAFVSLAHTEEDLNTTIKAAEEAFAEVAKLG